MKMQSGAHAWLACAPWCLGLPLVPWMPACLTWLPLGPWMPACLTWLPLGPWMPSCQPWLPSVSLWQLGVWMHLVWLSGHDLPVSFAAWRPALTGSRMPPSTLHAGAWSGYAGGVPVSSHSCTGEADQRPWWTGMPCHSPGGASAWPVSNATTTLWGPLASLPQLCMPSQTAAGLLPYWCLGQTLPVH